MSRFANRAITAPRARQQGISLLIVLILLVVMSVLGIAVLRSSALQERMAANVYDRSLAFQAAEAALRNIQNNILSAGAIDGFQYGQTLAEMRTAGHLDCASDGFCNRDPTAGTVEDPVWLSASFTTADGKTLPYQYTMEYLGTGKGSTVQGLCETTEGRNSYQCQRPMVRVSVRGEGPGHAQVVLQANIVSR